MLLEPRCKEESHSIALKPFGRYTRDMYLIARERVALVVVMDKLANRIR